MSLQPILEQFEGRRVVSLSERQLEIVDREAEEIEVHDTKMCGLIRLLRLEGRLFIQETTDKGELLMRSIDSLDAGRELIRGRLSTYERMWDGCGCRVDYRGD